jgi:hypothetical protein
MRHSAIRAERGTRVRVRQLAIGNRVFEIGWLLLGAGLAFWLLTLRPIGASDISDLGLVSAVSIGTWLGIALISIAFALACEERPISMTLAVACILAMALILYGTPAIAEPLPRFNTVYVHLGLIEAIARSGRFFPEVDARFSWPLFFAAAAMISQLGQFDLLSVAAWFPLATVLAVLPAMWILTYAFVNDRRLSLVALWFFILANWVAQDYLSPQGLNLVMYVWFLALIAWLFKRTPGPGDWVARLIARTRLPRQIFVDEIRGPIGPVVSRIGMLLVVVAIAFFSSSSHQLTPFAMVGASVGLVAVGRTSLRSMPIIVAVLAVLWVSFAGQEYLLGNLAKLLKDVGDPTGNTGAALAGRLRGSPGHIFVVTERILFTAAFWGLAVVGVWRRARTGFWDVGAIALAVVPFAIIAFQSYGGEIFLRVFLFALPAMSFLAATALFPVFYARSRAQTVALVVVSLALAVGFMIARYGNERAEIVEVAELQGADRAYQIMPQESLIGTINFDSPIRYRFFDLYDYLEMQGEIADLTVGEIAIQLDEAREGRPAYLFLSRGQRALEELLGLPPEAWDRIVAEVEASPLFEVEFQTPDASLYRFVPAGQP